MLRTGQEMEPYIRNIYKNLYGVKECEEHLSLKMTGKRKKTTKKSNAYILEKGKIICFEEEKNY